jgi:hypothetical protein
MSGTNKSPKITFVVNDSPASLQVLRYGSKERCLEPILTTQTTNQTVIIPAIDFRLSIQDPERPPVQPPGPDKPPVEPPTPDKPPVIPPGPDKPPVKPPGPDNPPAM